MMQPQYDTPAIFLGKLLQQSGDTSADGEFSRLPYQQGDQTALFETRGPARYTVDVHTLDHSEFWLQGKIHASVLQECARCLRPTDVPLEVTLGTLLRFDPKIETPFLDEDESGQEVWVFNQPLLDLSPYFAEAMLLALPLSVLHAPDCKGLCSKCGLDLNEGLCGRPDCIHAGAASSAPAPQPSGKQNPFAVLSGLELPDE